MSKTKNNLEALERYAASYIAVKAHEAIMADCKSAALEELNLAGGTAVVDGVEFCTKQIAEKQYGAAVQSILDHLAEQIEQTKKRAEEAGEVRVTYKETLAAKIPKSQAKTILSSVKEYRRYF